MPNYYMVGMTAAILGVFLLVSAPSINAQFNGLGAPTAVYNTQTK